MTSTKIKRTLSKFYGSGDETTEEMDDSNNSFDKYIADEKNIATSNSSNYSSNACSPNSKNKVKAKTKVESTEVSIVMNSKPLFKEDIIDGFAFLSFHSREDLESFLKNNKSRPPVGGIKENINKMCYDSKPKKQNSIPPSSQPLCQSTKFSVKITETVNRDDDSSSDATVEETVEDRMLNSFIETSEAATTLASNEGSDSNEIKVAVKRPPDDVEADDLIEPKRALWDSNVEVKPNLEGLCSAHSSIQIGSEACQMKSGLKKEVEDDDAMIEGVTRSEETSCNFPLNSADVKLIIKSDGELEPSKYDKQTPTFAGAKINVDNRVELAQVKKESTPTKRRSPTPDDVVVVLDDSSSHSGGASWFRLFPGLVFGDGKQLRNDSLLLGCARTDVKYDTSRIRNKNRNYNADKKLCQSASRRTSSIGPLSSSSSSINSSKAGFSPRHRVRVESPRLSDRLPPFRPPAFVPPRLTSPLHAAGSYCLPMPTVVPPAGLGVTIPTQQASMMSGWGQFELLAAQMAANQEMLRVQQGLNDRFLQDGNGGLHAVPLIGRTDFNMPMAIPGLQPTLTLRTEMHQHQHLHHHQHVVPVSPYAPLPTVPPPGHPMQTQMAPPMYFQPSTNIFSSSIHTRPGLPTRGAFIPMADHRSSSLPASQLLAKFRDRDWKQGNNGRPGFKGRWCSAHVQLAWRILMHCRGMKQQAEDAVYGSKFNLKCNDPSIAFKPSSGRIGSPTSLRQGWMNSSLGLKSERSGQEAPAMRMMDFARKERETVLRINSGRNQVDDFSYPSSHLPPSHFLHQSPLNAYNDKKDFLGIESGLNSYSRGLSASNDPSFYMSNKGPLNAFTSPLPPFLPLGDDLNISFRNHQDRKLIGDKYSTSGKDNRLPSPDSHHRNRTPSNSSLNSFPFFPPPLINSIQSNLHISGLQPQRYGNASINKPPTKSDFGSRQDMSLGFPNFHSGGFAKPYSGSDLMGGSLLPPMLDPSASSRSPFLKHPESRLASPSSSPLWSSYPPGMYLSATPGKPQETSQGKGSSMCLPVPPVTPLLPPFR